LKSKVTPMQPHSTTKMTSAVREMTIAKDGRTLYCAGADGSVRLTPRRAGTDGFFFAVLQRPGK
ncbi:MAG: hypothetical protein ACPHYE_07785, partial [Henriciella sp.]